MYRIRVWLTQVQYHDVVLPGSTCWIAENLGKGMSPVGRAQFLGEAN